MIVHTTTSYLRVNLRNTGTISDRAATAISNSCLVVSCDMLRRIVDSNKSSGSPMAFKVPDSPGWLVEQALPADT